MFIAQTQMRTYLLSSFVGLLLLTHLGWAPAQQEEVKPSPAPVELLIGAPEYFGETAEPFTAMLINRSPHTIALVPPNLNIENNLWTTWAVRDGEGYAVPKKPKTIIFCVGTTMYEQTEVWPDDPDLTPGVGDAAIRELEPILIPDEHLAILQPGEKLPIMGIIDPLSRFQIAKPGKYQLTLHYGFAPTAYTLAENSPKREALKNAISFDVTSNTVTVKLRTK